MINWKMDIYDERILLELFKDNSISLRELAEDLPFNKDTVRSRIKYLEGIGYVVSGGTTRGHKRVVTAEGKEWLRVNGHLS